MNENRRGADRDPRDEIDERAQQQPPRQETQAPLKALGEQTLAVDLARAEIDQQIATAHRFPRKLDVVAKKIGEMACYDEAAAENSVYALPRGGKAIVGPSIGFANIVAGSWGNCRDGARITYVDRKEKTVVAEGVFHDLETNRLTILPVNRRIVDSKGRLYTDDMIIVTGMAAGSIARRNAILNAVPRALWFPYYERALFIVRGSEEQLPDRREKGLKALAHFGVDPKQVMMYLGVEKLTDIGVEHMPTLRGMFSQLRDGAVTAAEMFDPRRMRGMAFDQIDNPLGDDDETAGAGDPSAAASGADVGTRQSGEAPSAVSGASSAPAVVTTGGAGASAAGTLANGPEKPAQAPAESAVSTAAGPGTRNGPAPAPAHPAQETKPAAKAAAAAQPPETGDEYMEYALGWLAATDSEAEIDNRYSAERKMRNGLRVRLEEEELAELKKAKEERKRALRQGK